MLGRTECKVNVGAGTRLQAQGEGQQQAVFHSSTSTLEVVIIEVFGLFLTSYAILE